MYILTNVSVDTDGKVYAGESQCFETKKEAVCSAKTQLAEDFSIELEKLTDEAQEHEKPYIISMERDGRFESYTVSEIPDKKTLSVETPAGSLKAYPSGDSECPGIYIDLHRAGCDADAPLLLIDFSHSEFPECSLKTSERGVLVCRCWRDVREDDYDPMDRTVFTGYEEFFTNK